LEEEDYEEWNGCFIPWTFAVQECQHQERGTTCVHTESGWHFIRYQKKNRKNPKTIMLVTCRKEEKNKTLISSPEKKKLTTLK
jgi:hypothetical protein